MLSAVIIGTGSAIAFFSDEEAAHNQLLLDKVDITLSETMQIEDGVVSYEPPQNVVPSQQISQIATIGNEGADAYVRAEITLCGFGDIADEERLHEILSGIDLNKWILKTELKSVEENEKNPLKAKVSLLFYGKEILPSNETMELFSAVTIPPDFDERWENEKPTVTVKAEAIQARNFTPDFESDSPWSDVPIEKYVAIK